MFAYPPGSPRERHERIKKRTNTAHKNTNRTIKNVISEHRRTKEKTGTTTDRDRDSHRHRQRQRHRHRDTGGPATERDRDNLGRQSL